MRILVVSDVSAHMPGGVPAEARQLIAALASRGHEILYAGDAAVVPSRLAQHSPIALPIGPELRVRIAELLVEFQPDVVHVLCMSSRGVLELASLLRGRPWVLTVHSVSPYERKLNRLHFHEGLHYGVRSLRFALNTLAWHWVLRRVEVPRVIVHSDFVARVVARYGVAARRVDRILLPFQRSANTPAVRAPAGEGPLLVTVAGLAHTKGQHDVVKALPALRARFARIRYHMIGEVRDASFVAWLQGLARRLGVTECISFSFGLDHAAKAEALAHADVYVQPSHEEGFCLSYIEAAAVVSRLVGTDTGAIAAMSRDDLGARVVPPRAPRVLGEAIADVLGVSLPKSHMADRAVRLSARFSEQAYADGHEAAFAAAQGEGGGR